MIMNKNKSIFLTLIVEIFFKKSEKKTRQTNKTVDKHIYNTWSLVLHDMVDYGNKTTRAIDTK